MKLKESTFHCMSVEPIDNFTKYMWIIPIENKETPELIRAMGEIVKAMGKPKKIYSDYEPGMENSIEFPKWLEENNILHIVTRSHANTAERAIRTFKDLLTRRIESKEIEINNQASLYVLLLHHTHLRRNIIFFTIIISHRLQDRCHCFQTSE